MGNYNIISISQQLGQIFQCMDKKLSQTDMPIIPVFCILEKVAQQRMIRYVQKILQEGFLLIQKNLKMSIVPLLVSDLLVEQLGVFKILVGLTLQLPNFFENLVQMSLMLRKRNFQLLSTTAFFFEFFLTSLQLILQFLELILVVKLCLADFVLCFDELLLLNGKAFISTLKSFTYFPTFILLFLNLFGGLGCSFPFLVEVKLQVLSIQGKFTNVMLEINILLFQHSNNPLEFVNL